MGTKNTATGSGFAESVGRAAEALRPQGGLTGVNNPTVTDPNPDHSTCFDGSETRLPSGYTKGRHLRVTAFSRSIASSGNDFEQRRPSRSLGLASPRDILVARPLRVPTPISPETLGRL